MTWRSYRRYPKRNPGPSTLEKSPEQTDPNIPKRIEELLKNIFLNDWERTFLPSILEAFNRAQSLSPGQLQAFKNVELRHSPEAQHARGAWADAWNEEKAALWKQMMEYYKRLHPYFQHSVEAWEKNPDRIPPESEYRKICENVYAKRYQKTSSIPPKFAAGTLVVWHEKYVGGGSGGHYLAMILEVGEVTKWAKGSREYKITLIGDSADKFSPYLQGPIYTEEKNLLYYRPSLDKKINP